MVILWADCGARPDEIASLEHPHVDAQNGRVFLPGTKTDNAPRTVTLTRRGVMAYRSVARRLDSPLVFHGDLGGKVNMQHWRTDV